MTSDKFLSLENLIGKERQEKLANSHACLIGLGGVGSWVAEALVRSGIGKLTLIDMDHIVASNIIDRSKQQKKILASPNFKR